MELEWYACSKSIEISFLLCNDAKIIMIHNNFKLRKHFVVVQFYKVEVKTHASPEEIDERRADYEKVVPGAWVRVCGPIRSFDNKCNVQAYKIRAVEHLNEVPNHMMAVMHEFMQLSGSIPSAADRRAKRLASTVTVPAGSGGGMLKKNFLKKIFG